MRAIKRRRRSAVTNYKKRIALLKGGMSRIVVRKSNRSIIMQVVKYGESGDKVVKSANSKELKGIGWEPRCNIPTAYLTGMLLAKKLDSKTEDFALDTGLYRPVKGSVIFAAAKGFQDAGANLHGNIEFDSSRLSGAHIASNASSMPDDKYKSVFSNYIKSGFDPKSISQRFEKTKNELASK